MPNRYRRTGLWLTLAGFACLFGLRGTAGEPIVFGTEKSKVDPVRESKFGKELSKPWENLPSSTPLDGMILPSFPGVGPLDRKRERQRKNRQDEQNNWMFLAPGELQAEDDEKHAFGLRDYDLENGDNENENRHVMFRDLLKGKTAGQANSSQRVPGQPQKANANQPLLRRESDDADDAKRQSRNAVNGLGKADSQTGAHTASELDLRNWFDPSQANTRNAEKSEFSLRDLLGVGASAGASREQQNLREEFRNFLNGSQPARAGSADGFNAARQPLNSFMPRPPDGPSRSAASDPFAPQAFGPRPAQASSPLLPGGSFVPGSPWSPIPPASAPPPATPSWKSSNFEIPRRK